jgi:DmsE family decaheme c-type cytochrome
MLPRESKTLKYAFLSLVSMLLLLLYSCETLKTSKPIQPIKEYEKMLLGRFDADYVGTDNCLKTCHFHDKLNHDFEASTMGAQMSPRTGMPLVDCESCHGPGSLAVEELTKEKVERDKKKGKQTACNYKTLIKLDELPPPAQSLICLKCHTANATFNLHNWNASEHSINDVSCSDCHRVHAGPDLIVSPQETYEMCYECHEDVRAEFSLPSRHPVPERKVICTDCHDPHGTTAGALLRKDTIRETCTECHAYKEGPFVFEHAEITEDCTVCHTRAYPSCVSSAMKATARGPIIYDAPSATPQFTAQISRRRPGKERLRDESQPGNGRPGERESLGTD